MITAQISYEEFGELTFLQWFSKAADYHKGDTEGYETRVGLTLEEGNANSIVFCSKKGRTVMIDLDFSHLSGTATEEAHRFLDKLGLSLRKGFTRMELKKRLGAPKSSRCGDLWEVGSAWPFLIVCFSEPKRGLFWVQIYRKDLADKESRH